MLVKIFAVLVASLLCISIRAEKVSLRKRTLQTATLQTATFECILLEMAAEFDGHISKFEHVCQAMDSDGDYSMMYSIDDNHGKVVDELGQKGLNIMQNSGRFHITMTNVIIELDPVITTTPSTEVIIEDLSNKGNRRLGDSSGIRSIVIFRVSFDDASPSNSATQIADAFFGIDGDSNNMRGRFAACSMNKLIFNPGTGNGFVNGVQELRLDRSGVGSNVHDIVNAITATVKSQFGSSLRSTYSNVVYALPRGTTFNVGGSDGWLAFAYVKSYLSVYNNENIMWISNQVHETGHNLGLMHSSHAGVSYGDQSGTMGYGYGKADTPQMCFNAAKSWTLGWYADKSAEIDPNDKITVNLDAFVDYGSVPPNDYVVLKVGTKYAIYNRKKGINIGTQEFADQVTITEMTRETGFSHGVGNLSSGQKYSFLYEGATAVIEMCSTEFSGGVDKAKVSIYMQSDGSGCSNPARSIPQTPAPIPRTPAPIQPPTQNPTLPPTRPPTQNPILLSTPGPTPGQAPRGLTEAPTRASVNSFETSCGVGELTLVITLKTDGKPNEISWYLKKHGHGGFGIGQGDGYTERLKEFVYRYCVSDDQIYEFHLSDSGGDGIQGSSGYGFYSIDVNGETYSEGGTFGSKQLVYIQGDCPLDSDKVFQFLLTTGTKPQDVSWELTSVPEGVMTESRGGPWPEHRDQSFSFMSHSCIAANACHTLTVKSSNGNGLQHGNFEIAWDNDNVGFSTFQSGSSEEYTFGSCEESEGRKLDN